MIRVLVVDDSPLVRKIATDILESDPGISVPATAANAGACASRRGKGGTWGTEEAERLRHLLAKRTSPVSRPTP